MSLAHRGVLFLDEAPEFSGKALDALRQPLESGHVVVARSAGVVRLPARFLMVLAANPCPCGRHTLHGAGCECPASLIRRYQARLSGPLLDRVDLRVQVEPVEPGRSDWDRAARGRPPRRSPPGCGEAREPGRPPGSTAHRGGSTARCRAMSCVPAGRLAPGALAAAERDMERGLLTARGLDRVLRVAWTVADLAGRDRPEAQDVDLALELRTGIARGVPVGIGAER